MEEIHYRTAPKFERCGRRISEQTAPFAAKTRPNSAFTRDRTSRNYRPRPLNRQVLFAARN